MLVVGEIHETGEVFDTDGDSLGVAKCDLRPAVPYSTSMTGTIIPYVGGRAAVRDGVSARFIGARLTCRSADLRIIQFQWFDTDGHVYRATVSPESK